MKSSLKNLALAAAAIFAINLPAQAGILLEPYLGYASGDAKQTTTSKFTGMEFGARAGYSILGFAGGVEYVGANFKDDATPSNEMTIGDIGVFVAYKFPVLVRGFITYVPSSEVKNSADGVSTTLKSGNQMKIGVGYTGFPFININLEYISGSYSKVGTDIGDFDLSPSLTTTGYALSISAPFDLL